MRREVEEASGQKRHQVLARRYLERCGSQCTVARCLLWPTDRPEMADDAAGRCTSSLWYKTFSEAGVLFCPNESAKREKQNLPKDKSVLTQMANKHGTTLNEAAQPKSKAEKMKKRNGKTATFGHSTRQHTHTHSHTQTGKCLNDL